MIIGGCFEFNKQIDLISYNVLQNDLNLKKEYLKWLNDFDVVGPILSAELMVEKDMTFVEKSFQRFTSTNCQGFFIKDNSIGKFVGTIKLDKINQTNKSAELGIMIGEKEVWGKNIGTKASLILMDYSFNTLHLHKIWGGTDELNIPMQKLFLKLGFQEEGRLREVNFYNQRYSDNFYYGILDKEYFDIRLNYSVDNLKNI